MMKLLKKFFKEADPVSSKCKHDWEIVRTSDMYYFNPVVKCYGKKGRAESLSPHSHWLLSTNREYAIQKVCMRCGECVDEEKKFKEAYEEQQVIARRKEVQANHRRSLAERMFKEGCNG